MKLAGASTFVARGEAAELFGCQAVLRRTVAKQLRQEFQTSHDRTVENRGLRPRQEPRSFRCHRRWRSAARLPPPRYHAPERYVQRLIGSTHKHRLLSQVDTETAKLTSHSLSSVVRCLLGRTFAYPKLFADLRVSKSFFVPQPQDE